MDHGGTYIYTYIHTCTLFNLESRVAKDKVVSSSSDIEKSKKVYINVGRGYKNNVARY